MSRGAQISDAINAMLATIAWNLKKLMKEIVKKVNRIVFVVLETPIRQC